MKYRSVTNEVLNDNYRWCRVNYVFKKGHQVLINKLKFCADGYKHNGLEKLRIKNSCEE